MTRTNFEMNPKKLVKQKKGLEDQLATSFVDKANNEYMLTLQS